MWVAAGSPPHSEKRQTTEPLGSAKACWAERRCVWRGVRLGCQQLLGAGCGGVSKPEAGSPARDQAPGGACGRCCGTGKGGFGQDPVLSLLLHDSF